MVTRPFENEVALVTGAGKNIGRAIAMRLAAGGGAVVVNGRADGAIVDEMVWDIRAAGGWAFGVLANVFDPEAVAHIMAQVNADGSSGKLVVISMALGSLSCSSAVRRANSMSSTWEPRAGK